MLEDRDYMRQPVYERRISFTVALLIVNGLVFIAECIAWGYPPNFSNDRFFALSLGGLEHGFIWQLLTYQFMHANIWHILLNCWAIFIFGREIEAFLGGKKFLTLFLVSGIIGGLVQTLFAWIWPGSFGGSVVGASAGAFGLVAAFAILFPEREITLLLFFVLPLRLTAKRLLLLSAALAVGGLFIKTNVANAAHLGGMLTGIILTFFIQGRWHLPQWNFPSRRRAQRQFAATPARKNSFWRSANEIPANEDLSADEFLQKEVDPILEKISAQGIQSLTKREREILEKARNKINRS